MLHREANQIREIPGLPIRKIGFISVNGFEEKEEGHCQKGRGAASWPGECQL
jgi:hypothetical protein